VIERTPTRHAVRPAQGNFISVTNDYEQLSTGGGACSSELLATSCARRDRVEALIGNQWPGDADACFAYLSDPGVKMGITVQHMVFRAATGEYWIRLPSAV
jgi:hypothetical protein